MIMAIAAAVMELDVQRAASGANITNFGDAAWWAVTTITSVGYGDHYPVTAAGGHRQRPDDSRLVSFGLRAAPGEGSR